MLGFGLLATVACGPDIRVLPSGSSGDPGSSTGMPEMLSTSGAAPTGSGSTGADDESSSTSSGPGVVATSSSTGGGCEPRLCDGLVYDCVDGEDNDGDGLVDLDDPHCTSPCDDTEESFHPGIPDSFDCKLDCAFDGNSGHGDDGCITDMRCDEANPGADVTCEYTGGNNCLNQLPEQDEECRAFCEPFVPPGCDCFGCCTVATPEGPRHIQVLVAYQEECTLDNLDACPTCTSQIDDCGNPCTGCEVCFGETGPPAGCDEPACDTGPVCTTSCDCPDGGYCQLGCCHPAPPG